MDVRVVTLLVALQALLSQITLAGNISWPHPKEEFRCAEGSFREIAPCLQNFYVCIGNQLRMLTCPGKDIFFQFSCRSPENVPQCVTIADMNCPHDGFFPDPKRPCSSSFISCVDDIAYPETCPNSFIFDPLVGYCVLPHRAACTSAGILGVARFNCPQDGFFPDPDKPCSRDYLTCVQGIAYPQSCPGISIFDSRLLKCVTSDLASCSNGGFECSRNDGFFPDPGKPCDGSFYLCINKVPYPNMCPETSIFDPRDGFCVPPDSASCRLTTLSPTTSVFVCPSNGFFADPALPCTGNFYSCINGIPYPEKCVGTAVFDPVNRTCVAAGTASCKTSTTLSTTTTTPTTTSAGFRCPSRNGFFPDPSASCSGKYFTCVNSKAYPSSCPGESKFDSFLDVCAATDQTSCGYVCPGQNGFYPNPSQPCSGNLYICVNKVPNAQSCPGTSIFDPSLSICVTANSASCMTTIPTTTITTSTASSTTTSNGLRCPRPDGFFPDPTKPCTGSYISCVSGTAYPMSCPGTSIFDPPVSTCVGVSSASCITTTSSSTVITTTTSSTTVTTSTTPSTTTKTTSTTTSRPGFTCPGNGFYPDPRRPCSGSFYTCANCQPYLDSCPGTTIFDPLDNVCVDESEASCKTTTISSIGTTTSVTTRSPTTSAISTVPPSIFTCPEPYGYYAIPGAVCSTKYIQCSAYIGYYQNCAPGTVWNNRIQVCDWPFNVPGC